MSEWLSAEFFISPAPTVLYDRPSSLFTDLRARSRSQRYSDTEGSAGERRALLRRLGFECLLSPSDPRTALLISSTSWSPDEDFGLLLSALKIVDAALQRDAPTSGGFTRLLMVVTGKGPLKKSFEAAVAASFEDGSLDRLRVDVRTVWLEPGEYPLLMSCADLGVSLHTSSSGLDLPMKVLDMFGAGLPVLAADFQALPELLRHGENGLVFKTHGELASQILRLLFNKDGDGERGLDELTKLAICAGELSTWDQNWDNVMKPLVQKILKEK
jgi:beta-1,4-mannosyltransferase